MLVLLLYLQQYTAYRVVPGLLVRAVLSILASMWHAGSFATGYDMALMGRRAERCIATVLGCGRQAYGRIALLISLIRTSSPHHQQAVNYTEQVAKAE